MTGSGDFKLTFGKYNGKTLDQVAESDEGLLWVDWFVGEVQSPRLKTIFQGFLRDDDLQTRLDILLEDK